MLTQGQVRALEAIAHPHRYVRNAPRGFQVAVHSLIKRGIVRELVTGAYWPSDFEVVSLETSK